MEKGPKVYNPVLNSSLLKLNFSMCSGKWGRLLNFANGYVDKQV